MSDAEGGLKVIELARAAGLSIRTVRYYDQIGHPHRGAQHSPTRPRRAHV